VTRFHIPALSSTRSLIDGPPCRLLPRHSRRTLFGLFLASVLVPQRTAQAQAIVPLTPPGPVQPVSNDPLPPIPVPADPSSELPDPGESASTLPVIDSGSQPFRAWYFAEGNSRNGFETYFTLLNLSDQPASVSALYNRDDGIRLTQWLGIEPHARLSLSANAVVGARAFGTSFFADQDIVVERTTTWGPGQNGETLIGFAPDGMQTWHFAEGTTRGRVTTYFVTQNLSDAPASVTATFTRDDGSREKRQYGIPPRGREAYRVNDLLKDTAFSASIRADQDIVVERTIMIEGERPPTVKRSREDKGPNVMANGRTDDSFVMARNALGIFGGLGYPDSGSEPGSRAWEFAEGSTRSPYRTTFVLFNAGQQDTDVRFVFRLEQGGIRSKTVRLGASSRLAFDPKDAVPAADFATSISADHPIIAERAYASSGDGLYGALGYTSLPPRKDSRVWYFAEGNTTNQIEMFFILYSLSTQTAQVKATYYIDGASSREQTLTLPAGARLAIRANDNVAGNFFATRFVADQNIMVERTLYLAGGSGFTTVGAGAVPA
jgi:hypothetical protein